MPPVKVKLLGCALISLRAELAQCGPVGVMRFIGLGA
jgi:hypothetical protein